MHVRGYAAPHPRVVPTPFSFTRRDPGDHDVAFAVSYCGVCHSDIHQVDEDWGPGIFPMVPGHEVVGVVTEVGSAVTSFAVGDRIGVGTFVDSCRVCEFCRRGEEQYCVEGDTPTYNGLERDGVTPTFGGYCDRFVVDEAYAVRIPDGLEMAGAAPLLCAGITVYSPLRHWGAGAGTKVGVVGLGGLGHLAVKFAVALGATTTVFSHSAAKGADAARLGAHAFVDTSDAAALTPLAGTLDLIVNTVSAPLDLERYLDLLSVDGSLILVGLPGAPYSLGAGTLVSKRRTVAGSMAGGTRELQEMLDFCARHGIVSDVEVVAASDIATAFARTRASDVKYRFVIDATTFAEA